MSYGIVEMECKECFRKWNTEWGVTGTHVWRSVTKCAWCGWDGVAHPMPALGSSMEDLYRRYHQWIEEMSKHLLNLTPVTEYVKALQDVADGIEKPHEGLQ